MPDKQQNERIENESPIQQVMTNRLVILTITVVVSILMLIVMSQYFIRKAPFLCKQGNTVSVLPASCGSDIDISKYIIIDEAEEHEREWKQGNEKIPLTRDAHACYLTKITGNIRGKDEAVWIERDNDNMWYLLGKSKAHAVGAKARCIKLKIKLAE